MSRGKTWTDHQKQRDRESRRHYPPSTLGRTCGECGKRMVAALDQEPYNCHPSCDPRFGPLRAAAARSAS